jgi:hypothetical protein
MNLFVEWLRTAKSVIRSPSKTLKSETRDSGFGYPLKFMVVSLMFAGVLNTAARAFSASATPGLTASAADLGFYFVGSVIGGPVILALLAGLIHVFAYLLGARSGYERTLAAISYGTAVAPLAAFFSLVSVFIPLMGIVAALISLWALQIQARGVQHFHEISANRATLAVLMPLIIVVVVAWIAVFAAFQSLMAA